MDLEVYNTQFDGVDILEEKQSVIFKLDYDDVGNFEVYAPATKKNCELLQKHYMIYNPQVPESMGLIDSIVISSTYGDGDYIQASGMTVNGLLEGKLTGFSEFSGNIQTTMRNFVSSICMDSSSLYYLPFLELGTVDANITDTLSGSVQYQDLSVFCNALCRSFGIGYRIKPDISRKKLQFECYKGIDRSIGQNVVPQMIFSDEYENMKSSEYAYSEANMYNVVVAYTASDNGRLSYVYNPGEVSGSNVVAEAVQCEDQFVQHINMETGEEFYVYSKALTLIKMQEVAKEKYVAAVENFKGECNQIALNAYGTDWYLGDIVTSMNKAWNKQISQRVEQVTLVSDETNPFYVNPVFGSREYTMSDLFKNKKG